MKGARGLTLVEVAAAAALLSVLVAALGGWLVSAMTLRQKLTHSLALERAISACAAAIERDLRCFDARERGPRVVVQPGELWIATRAIASEGSVWHGYRFDARAGVLLFEVRDRRREHVISPEQVALGELLSFEATLERKGAALSVAFGPSQGEAAHARFEIR